MAEVEAVAQVAQDVTAKPAKASPKKKAAGVKKPKKPSDHPKYSEMIKQALTQLQEKGGSSRQALLKYIVKNFTMAFDEKTINAHLKLALRAGIKNGSLKQSKGVGAAGSFKLGGVEKTAVKNVGSKKVVKSPKKAATAVIGAKKVVKKAVSPKKAVVKKSSKKPAVKSPAKVKQAAKPAAVKKPAAPKAAAPSTPKKAAVLKKLKIAKPATSKTAKPIAANKSKSPKKAAAKPKASKAKKVAAKK